MIPGEVLVGDGELELNAGRKTVKVNVSNTGDRPIQVGSHFHFFETNEALSFDRTKARGYRLNIAAGTAVRFEPGQQREVELVALAGDRIVYGFNALIMGRLDALPPTLTLPRKRGRGLTPSSAKRGRGLTPSSAKRGGAGVGTTPARPAAKSRAPKKGAKK